MDSWLVVGILVVCVILVVVVSQDYTIGSNGIQRKADLSVLMSPYLALGNYAAGCTEGGGIWFWTPTKVGCQDYAPTPLNCSTALVMAARTQCNAVGATFICDTENVLCNYS